MIILALFKSIERTLAVKLPFSVATVTTEYPAPGGPETAAAEGFGVVKTAGFDEGVVMGIKVGLEDGGELGLTEGVGDGKNSSRYSSSLDKKTMPTRTIIIKIGISGKIKPFFFT